MANLHVKTQISNRKTQNYNSKLKSKKATLSFKKF
jgi:hypothetical protein